MADAFYERDGLPDHPFGALMRGELPKEELRNWWNTARMWDVNLLFNQFTLPRLLRLCPDPDARAELWEVINPEFGFGEEEKAHPTLARRFFLALGIPEESLKLYVDPEDPLVKSRVQELERLSFIELLARFLAPEIVGPKIFPAYCAALKASYGMKDEDVEFYRFHGLEDRKDSAVLFELVARFARTVEDQEAVRRVLIRYFDQERLRCLCVLRPLDFNFTDAFESRE